MNPEFTPEQLKKLVPVLSQKEKQEMLFYYAVYGKYEKEISEIALKDLEKHPIFGELIRSIPEETREAQNKVSRQLQQDALVNDNWIPYIEYQLSQGIVYARMGLEFSSWYEVVILVKKYVTPYIAKENQNISQIISCINGMNHFMDIAMGFIGEAYLSEKQKIIERDRSELEKTLKEVSDYKYALDESSIVAVTNQKGIITHANDNFCKISKFSREELIGQDHRIINSGYHPKEFIKTIWTTLAKGNVWKGEIKNRAKDGTTYWVDTTIVPFLNGDGKPYQYVAIRTDVTQKKKSEKEIIQLNNELEKKIEERTSQLQQSLDEILNFRSLFETTPGLFLVMLPDLTINAVTDEYLEATMLKREDIIGKYLFDVFPDNPDDPTADGVSNLHTSLNTVLETKKSHVMALQKYDIRKPDGTFEERYWSPINKPVLNSKGEVVYLTHGVTDVTKQLKHQEEILRISDENLDLYDNAPCGYLSVDSDIFLSNINKTLLGWLGYSKEEVIGKMKFEDLLSPESREIHLRTFDDVFAQYVKTGKVSDLEFDFLRKDKSTFPALINSAAVFDEDGKFVRSRTVVLDNTYRKKAEHTLKEANAELEAQAQKLQASEEELRAQQEELMQANLELEEKSLLLEEKNEELVLKSQELYQKADELAQSSRYKSEFLANMSHELRTPLNSILLLSRLLADNGEKNLTGEQTEFARVINNSGNGLLDLINEILDLSKIESGKMTVDIEPVEISGLCKTVLEIFSPLAHDKGITLTVEKHLNIPEIIITDRTRIEQVLKNFLSNAVKFTESGTVEMTVRKPVESEIGSSKTDPEKLLVFEVTDTGIGIPEEKQSLVFEAFQQADGSTRRKYGGTGLGLSISKKIAQLLGGDLTLKSEHGKGSSFGLIIPVDGNNIESSEKVVYRATGIDRTEKKGISNAPGKDVVTFIPEEIEDDRLSIETGDKTILIIEDDTILARDLMTKIKDKGYKVVVAVSGSNAVEYAINFQPAGILLDIQLPVKSGWTVLTDLKQNDITRHIPVQLMSFYEISKKESIELGAIDYIMKPIKSKALDNILNHLDAVTEKLPKTILLVNDNDVRMSAIMDFIAHPGVKCVSADTADDARALLNKFRFDCLIIDIDMAAESGYSILDTLQKDKKFYLMPVIVYTGKSLPHLEEKRIRQYTHDLILKTADTYRNLSKEISFFLHIKTNTEEEKRPVKPYLKEHALAGKHVLVVDDDVRNIFSLTKLLESQKIKVSSSIDGNEALDLLVNDQSIDLVLMDMMMPNKDGYETIADIRQNPIINKTRVIAVTAKAMPGDREKCINAGANDYITKPVDEDQLISLLKVWLYK